MEDDVGKQLATFAFASRLFLIVFQFLSNLLLPDHDAKVFNPPIDRKSFSTLDDMVELTLGGFRRWDAVYFTHIAEHGYTYENSAAFFPLFPVVVTICAHCVSFSSLLHLHTSVILVAVFMNCVLFAYTAKNLYALGLKVGLDSKTSLLSSFLFCMNPSSIFMTAPYSETLYMFLLVLSLLLLQEKKTFTASFFIGLSIFTRSNGLVGIGFVLHHIVLMFTVLLLNINSCENKKCQFLILIFQTISKICINVFVSVIPFFLYQYYIYLKFCFPNSSKHNILLHHLISYGRMNNYKLPGDDPSPWCENTLPFSYSYIQSHNWGVGFFRYYQFKQIPNFLLAAPVIYYSATCCLYFFHLNHGVFYGLGLIDLSKWLKPQSRTESASKTEELAEKTRLASNTAVFVFHLAFMLLFGCIFVHIQVLTRMLFSSAPILFWYCGIMLDKDKVISKFTEELLMEAEVSPKANTFRNSAFNDAPSADDVTSMNHANIWRSNVTTRHEIFVRKSLHSLPKTNRFTSTFSKNLGLQMMHYFMYMKWASLSSSSHAIFLYFGAYFIIGTIMFSNFLPWT